MKVKDLIMELQKHDQELEVEVYDWGEEYRAPMLLEKDKITTKFSEGSLTIGYKD